MRKQFNPFQLTEDDESLIEALLKIGRKSWTDKTINIDGTDYTLQRNSLRNRISVYLENEQDGFCAYCATVGSGIREVEHFFKKSTYPNLTWNPNNLLSSCIDCNHRRKGTRNFVINPPAADERDLIVDATQLDCSVVNPLLDNPNEHIIWSANIILCLGHRTTMGQKTIATFEIDGNNVTLMRSATHDKHNHPLTADEEIELAKIISIPRVRA
ncbi:MAG: hypothetical protein WC635_02805 [Bacteriovorax sp.]|jgi:uncharacterized protein (TIGR02646 family)